jgi:protein-disulfide isomerase
LAYYSKVNLVRYAGLIKLDTKKFETCLNADKYAAQVNQDLVEGQQAGVEGTPTIFINGIPLVGAQPYEIIKAKIEQVLAK